MKIPAFLFVATLALAAPALAAKGKKKRHENGGGNPAASIVRQFDTNANHQIDGTEIAALKSAFASAKPESDLKKLDRNGNGAVDEDEVTAVNARAQGDPGANGKKKKKKKKKKA